MGVICYRKIATLSLVSNSTQDYELIDDIIILAMFHASELGLEKDERIQMQLLE